MNLRRAFLVAAMVAAGGALAGKAQAQCNGYGGYGYGYWDIGRLYSVLANNVPYYAAFPPVYYSYPVPRTYGWSPFAYPPGVMTPEVEVAEPLSIINPHFKGSESGTVDATKGDQADQTTSVEQAPKPLLVVNPYVTGSGNLAAK